MKKFLAILLIAIVACEAVEEITLESLIDTIIDQLKKWGVYDALINQGKKIALDFCKKYLDEGLCQMGISYLCQLLKIQC